MLLSCSFLLNAQTRLVKGKVNSSLDNEPLIGASVIVSGTTIGTITDMDGNFSLQIPVNANELTFSFVGFLTEKVDPTGKEEFFIVLTPDLATLEDVVVVAYGTTKKEAITGSTLQIKTEKIASKPFTNISKALEGSGPGIQVISASGQPGSGISLRIRGVGSINASSDPLYVVDGVPYSGNLSSINPDDIQSISVLKDASSSTLYGSKAANGVVMIQTKKGTKDRHQINVKISHGFSNRGIPEYDRVNAKQYYPLLWEAYRNSLAYRTSNPIPLDTAGLIASGHLPKYTSGANAGLQRYKTSAYNSIKQNLGYNPFNVADTAIMRPDGTLNPNAELIYGDDLDWADAIARTGKRSDYGISYTGGNEKSDYFVSLNYLEEGGFTIKSDFQRLTGRINVNTQPKKWVKLGLNLSGAMSKSNVANDESSTGYVNPFYFTRNIGPIYPIYAHDPATGEYLLDSDNQRIYDYGNLTALGLPARPSGASSGRHVIAETKWNDNLYKRNVVGARTYTEFYFLKDFKFTTNLALDVNNYLASDFDNKQVGDGAPAGRASKTNSITTSYTFNQLLNYSKVIGNHSFEALLGHENYDYEYNYLYGFRQGIIVDGNTELINFTTTNDLTSYTNTYRTEGYFSRLNYNFDGRYFGSLSYRRDGSSKFHADKRWGDFWSIGGGWRLDKEIFMNSFSQINLFKIRGSYGETGNDDLSGYYLYQALYSLGVNNGNEPGFLQQSLGNKDLVWEAQKNFDIGLEFGFLENRISGAFEYFHRESSNLLFKVPLPLSSGMENQDKNVGTMWNKGFEGIIAVDIFRRNDFAWTVDVNFTTFKNQVTKLPEGQVEIISGTKKLMKGQSIYDFWLREWYGVDPNDGAGLYRANLWNASNCRIVGSDTVTTSSNNARYHYAGSAIPDFYGSITNTVTYKNFEFSFMLTYQIGGKVYDSNYAALMNAGSYGNALSTDILNRWRTPGDITDVPRMDVTTATEYNAQSDRWLIDASFLNVKSINLTYNLPKKVLSKTGIQNARIYCSVDNAYLFSKRKGMNVQQSFAGVTSNTYLPARIISLGINFTL